MEQRRLFKIAPDAIALSARWEYPTGWCLTATIHRTGESGSEAVTERYERLSADELADVASCVMSEALRGISG